MHSARLCGQQILNNKRKTKKKGDPLEITKKKQKKILCQYRFTLEMKAVFVVSRNGGFFSNFTSKFAVLFCLVRPCEFSIVVFLLIYTTHKQAPATPRTRVKWGNIYRYIPLLRRIIKIGKEKKEWGIYTERFEREAKKTTRLEEAKLLSFLLLLLFCCCFDPTNFEFIVCVWVQWGGLFVTPSHVVWNARWQPESGSYLPGHAVPTSSCNFPPLQSQPSWVNSEQKSFLFCKRGFYFLARFVSINRLVSNSGTAV